MDLLSVFTLFGGLALFLFGMNVMSENLRSVAGEKLECALSALTSGKIKGLLLGLISTAAVQSSSAVTVLLIGFAESGILKAEQSVFVIMGSNIGTTATAWLLSFSSINGPSPILSILNPDFFVPPIAVAGIVLLLRKGERAKSLGYVMLGFSVLMYSMELMKESVQPLCESDSFKSLLTAFQNPLLSIIAGAVFTAAIQSSSASVGILQSLAASGAVTYGAAVPIIMGQNLGTCVTALLSSIGVGKNARQVTAIHLLFNLSGVFFCLVIFCAVNAFFDLENLSVSPPEIALLHTLFNTVTTLILLPFSDRLANISKRLVKQQNQI